MPNAIDLTGQRFNRLTVIERAGHGPSGRTQWLCRCNCGTILTVSTNDLRKKHTQSCGCLKSERTSARMRIQQTTHGLSTTPTYKSWNAMMRRCFNPIDSKYEYYGGSGTSVCQRWQQFENFLEDMGTRPKGLTIDRIDNKGHYSCGKCEQCIANGWPINCRWATRKEQAVNSSRIHWITFRGETLSLTDWAARLGIDLGPLLWRLRHWSLEDALTKPKRR